MMPERPEIHIDFPTSLLIGLHIKFSYLAKPLNDMKEYICIFFKYAYLT